MGSPPPPPDTFILSLSYPTSHTNTGHFNCERAIHDPVCGITASRDSFPFINIDVCLHLSELISKNPQSHKKIDRDTLWLVNKTDFFTHSRLSKDKKARNLCAICMLCDSAKVRAKSSFIEIISNGWNPY